MNRNLVISILVTILALVAGYWVWQGNTRIDIPTDQGESINPRDLKVGQVVGGFIVESVKLDGDDYEVQLRGEKVVAGRSYLGNAVDGDGTLLCFYTDETRESLIVGIPEVENGFCVRDTTWDNFYNQIPADKKNKGFLYVKVRVVDPVLALESWGDTVELLEILEVSNTPL